MYLSKIKASAKNSTITNIAIQVANNFRFRLNYFYSRLVRRLIKKSLIIATGTAASNKIVIQRKISFQSFWESSGSKTYCTSCTNSKSIKIQHENVNEKIKRFVLACWIPLSFGRYNKSNFWDKSRVNTNVLPFRSIIFNINLN